MKMKLFGVMGSVSGGDSDLGKNSTCLVLSHKNNDLILDSGTGILKYMKDVTKNDYHILLSHYHTDHILGFPFIPQLFDSNKTINIYGPKLNDKTAKEELLKFIKEPYFPIKSSHFLAKLISTTLLESEVYMINGFEVQSFLVDHPGGCFIYSIKIDGKKVCFLSDFPNGMDLSKDIINFCLNSDLIYADAMFLERELQNKEFLKYGHSSIESVIRFFKKTKSKKLVIGHHNSFRNYDDVSQYETESIIVSKENLVINI